MERVYIDTVQYGTGVSCEVCGAGLFLGGGGLDMREIGADRVHQWSDTKEQGSLSPWLITCHFPYCPLIGELTYIHRHTHAPGPGWEAFSLKPATIVCLPLASPNPQPSSEKK